MVNTYKNMYNRLKTKILYLFTYILSIRAGFMRIFFIIFSNNQSFTIFHLFHISMYSLTESCSKNRQHNACYVAVRFSGSGSNVSPLLYQSKLRNRSSFNRRDAWCWVELAPTKETMGSRKVLLRVLF